MLKPKYFLYARKSTEDDDHQIMSIEAQLFELREYARRENLEILAEFTEAKSAKKPGREKFAEMINEIENLTALEFYHGTPTASRVIVWTVGKLSISWTRKK